MNLFIITAFMRIIVLFIRSAGDQIINTKCQSMYVLAISIMASSPFELKCQEDKLTNIWSLVFGHQPIQWQGQIFAWTVINKFILYLLLFSK